MISQEDLIKKLVFWLKDNRATTLADKLGYKSTGTISQWLYKKRVPHHMHDRVLTIISKKG